MGWSSKRAFAAAFAAGALLACAAPAAAQIPGVPPLPIPQDPLSSSPTFEGTPATPAPIRGVPEPPRHPFMAPNGRSNIHNDAFMSDVYRGPGPLGDGPEVSTFFARECASIAFDAQGRIVSICVGLERPVLVLLDPRTLQTLAAKPLPLRNFQSGANPFTDFSGGGYFYLDHRDRAVVPTNDRRVLVVAIAPGPRLKTVRSYDLSSQMPAGDGIISILPDWEGGLWFVSRGGLVGTIEPDSGEVRTLRLEGEGISNSFAVDETGGVYIVSDAAFYRFDAGSGGEPAVSWRQPYPDTEVHKPGQSDAGSGTTPTVMGRKWVAITDNADPMNVRVYRRTKRPLAQREVCSAPVFAQGASATDQSLIATNRSIVAENNYGYSVAATAGGRTTTPGLERIDVVEDGDGHACRKVWSSDEIAPSVVPKLSLAAGLVYTYTKPPGSATEDPWYLTALDFRTGKTVYRRLAGEGLGYNNNYAPVTLGPDGTAYVGVLGGLVALP